MRAEALLAEGWVSPRLRLERKRGESSGANEKAASSPELYNSVTQRLSGAITKFLQQGDFQWTIGFLKLCVQRARTRQFFYHEFASRFPQGENPPVDFLHSGGLLSP